MLIDKNKIRWYGRNFDNDGIRYFDYSCSGFEFCFTGKKACATIVSDSQNFKENEPCVLGIYVKIISSEKEYTGSSFWDSYTGEEPVRLILRENEKNYVLFENDEEKTVIVKVLKLSECAYGYAGFKSLELNEGSVLHNPSAVSSDNLKIEFIGDSITCGYGLEGVWEKDTFTTLHERPDETYAFWASKELKAEFQYCSWSGIGIISNYVDPATVNLPETRWLMPACWPYTDKSCALRLKIEPEIWDESRFRPDIVVINIGTNDTSWVRGIEDRRLSYVSGLRQLIEAVHRRSPNAKICCSLGIMGQDLCDSVKEACELFANDFPQVQIKSVKFDLQKEEDGIGTDWHPSLVTHKKTGAKLASELKNW